MKDVLTLILGGGRGTRLFPLTHMRSKPAVPIGGKYRLIDIPISNCLHAGLKRIFVLTQFNSASLNRHIAQTYRLDMFSEGFVEVLAAEHGETPELVRLTRSIPSYYLKYYYKFADVLAEQRNGAESRAGEVMDIEFELLTMWRRLSSIVF